MKTSASELFTVMQCDDTSFDFISTTREEAVIEADRLNQLVKEQYHGYVSPYEAMTVADAVNVVYHNANY